LVTILIIIGMLASFSLGAYSATKTLQMGLKYKMQVEEGTKTELNTIEKIVNSESDRKELDKYNSELKEMFSDIMGGF